MKKIAFKDNEKQPKMSAQHIKDIENGKVLPTFEEFFKLCILYGIAENVNLKDMYPTLYRDYKRDMEE